jgi:hypothetical protein
MVSAPARGAARRANTTLLPDSLISFQTTKTEPDGPTASAGLTIAGPGGAPWGAVGRGGERRAGGLHKHPARVGRGGDGGGAAAQEQLADGGRVRRAVGDVLEAEGVVKQENAVAGHVIPGVDAGADVAGVVVAGEG